MRVFVYGTLKRGFHNHGLLETSEYIGEDAIKGTLIDFGLPGLIPGSGIVKGEVYDVNVETLTLLDRLEGHPNFYERKTTVTEGGWGVSYYEYKPRFHVGRAKIVQSGEWR